MRTTETSELLIRRGTQDDTQQILDLVRLSLGEGLIPRSETYWNWKHHENPFGQSPMLLAEHDGKLVGLRVFMRWEWSAAGQTFRAVRAVDTATHPEFRGRGIFSRLTKQLVEEVRDEGVDFIFNTPNEKSRPGYLKMGWESVGRTNVAIRPLRPIRLARTFLDRRKVEASADTGHDAPPASFPTAASVLDGSGMEMLVRSSGQPSTDQGYTTPISLDYLRWRYVRIPGFTYFVLHDATADGSAAVVFRYKTQGLLRELRIADLLMGGTRQSQRIMRRLLRRVISTCGADYVSAMPMSAASRKILYETLFLPAFRIGPILTVRDLNMGPNHPPITNLPSWSLSTGALELF